MKTELQILLEPLERKYNSAHAEAKRYYELCDNDLRLLERLYYIMKLLITFKVPTTKEEVNKILNTSLTIKHVSGAIGRLKPDYDVIDNTKTYYGSKQQTHYATQWSKGVINFWQPRSNFKLHE